MAQHAASKKKVPVKREEVTEQLMAEIFDKVAEGMPIVHALKQDDRYPNWHLFAKILRENEAYARQYARAMQMRAFSLEASIEDYKSLLLAKAIDPQTANVLIQTAKWQAGKFYPKLFGDNIKLSVQDIDEQQSASITIEVVKRQLTDNNTITISSNDESQPPELLE